MKKFFGFLAILATLSGIPSLAMAKSFSDVKDAKYKDAVNILSDLSIINGYEDGTYKPNNSVKRSEMAKLLIVAMGKEGSARVLEGDTTFEDVTSSHWASGYINLASSLGLIKGYPDNTFRPDATVSYVEASTMLLRALDYKKELDNLSWPTGYMSKANSAGLLENVSANSSSDAANRGNVASMILNTLRAGTRKIIETNSTGNVYGDGIALGEKVFEDLICVKEGTITGIDFEDSEIVVQDKTNDRKLTLDYENDNIKEIFGRKISFIYDDEKDKFLLLEFDDNLTVKTVNVDEIDNGVLFDDTDEYKLPKSSNILLYGTSKYEDVKKAYLTLDKKEVVYAVLEGTEKIYAGIVTDENFKINNNAAVEVKTATGEYEEYVLANSSESIAVGDMILFALNADNEILIRKNEEVEDALKIEAKTSSSITLKGGGKTTFATEEDYKVYLISQNTIKEGSLSEIEIDFDLATVEKVHDTYYVLVFVDGIDPDDIEVDISVSDAKDELEDAIDIADSKRESRYSVRSFAILENALEKAEKIYKSNTSYSAAEIVVATRRLENAIENLEEVTSADIELRAAYDDLKDAIASAEKIDKSIYTAETYKVLSDAITAGKRIDLTVTTLPKVTAATDNITKARAKLVTNLASEQLKSIITRLDNAIKAGDAKLRYESTYTAESFSAMKTALNEAKNLDRTLVGKSELNTVTTNLEIALEELKTKEQEAYETAKAKLDSNLKIANAKLERGHTEASWKLFKPELDAVNAAYKNISSLSTTEIKNLNTKLESALKKLRPVTEENIRQNKLTKIREFITIMEGYTQSKWETEKSYPTWNSASKKLTEAKAIIGDTEKYTTSKLTEFAASLDEYVLF